MCIVRMSQLTKQYCNPKNSVTVTFVQFEIMITFPWKVIICSHTIVPQLWNTHRLAIVQEKTLDLTFLCNLFVISLYQVTFYMNAQQWDLFTSVTIRPEAPKCTCKV